MQTATLHLWSHQAEAIVIEYYGRRVWGVAANPFQHGTWDLVHIPASFIAGPGFPSRDRARYAAEQMYRLASGEINTEDKSLVRGAYPDRIYSYLRVVAELPEGKQLSYRRWEAMGMPDWEKVRRAVQKAGKRNAK